MFLGVRTEGCRRRFVCELDIRARTNPVTRLAFSFISRNFFEQYRNVEGIHEKPQKFGDCARMFNDCKDAEKYNNNDDDDNEYDDKETNNEYADEIATVAGSDGDAAVTDTNISVQDSANEVRYMRQYNDEVAKYVHLNRNNMQKE